MTLQWYTKELWLFHGPQQPGTRILFAYLKNVDLQKDTKYVVSVHAAQAYRGSRSIDPLILNLGTRWGWVVKFTSGKEPREPPNMRQTGPKNLCGRFRQQKNLLPLSRLAPDRLALASVPVQTMPHRLTAMRRTKRKICAEYCFRPGMTIHDVLATWELKGKSRARAYQALQPQRAKISSRMLSQSLQWNSTVQKVMFLKVTQFTTLYTKLAITVRNKIRVLWNPSGNKTKRQAKKSSGFEIIWLQIFQNNEKWMRSDNVLGLKPLDHKSTTGWTGTL